MQYIVFTLLLRKGEVSPQVCNNVYWRAVENIGIISKGAPTYEDDIKSLAGEGNEHRDTDEDEYSYGEPPVTTHLHQCLINRRHGYDKVG